MSERLSGNIAYITGAASGIGFATAELFAQEGAQVMAVDTNSEGLQKLSEATEPQSITTAIVDIRDSDQIKASIEQTNARYGTPNILVNCAAVFDMQPLAEASVEDKERSWEVNVEGTQQVTELVVEAMAKASTRGSIVQVASVSGMGSRADETVYSETKAAIIAEAAKQTVALGKIGIRVNIVSPGPILTSATRKHADQVGIDIENFKKGAENGTLLGRMGTPQEVAKAILFLSSTEASYITGSNLVVDGGLSVK